MILRIRIFVNRKILVFRIFLRNMTILRKIVRIRLILRIRIFVNTGHKMQDQNELVFFSKVQVTQHIFK